MLRHGLGRRNCTDLGSQGQALGCGPQKGGAWQGYVQPSALLSTSAKAGLAGPRTRSRQGQGAPCTDNTEPGMTRTPGHPLLGGDPREHGAIAAPRPAARRTLICIYNNRAHLPPVTFAARRASMKQCGESPGRWAPSLTKTTHDRARQDQWVRGSCKPSLLCRSSRAAKGSHPSPRCPKSARLSNTSVLRAGSLTAC